MARRILNRGLIVALVLLAAGTAVSLLQADREELAVDQVSLEAIAAGGPDNFGYTFADNSTSVCSYQFVDIANTGTVVPLGDDFTAGPLALNDPFNLYGVEYKELFMSSNGFLATEDDFGDDSTNDCPLPAVPSEGTGARMYALHDDLVTDQGFHQFFSSCPRAGRSAGEPCTIFQWDNTFHFGSTSAFDMQAILYHGTCEVVFQIGAGNPELGATSTTGIQDPAATSGLAYACNAAGSVTDATAVCFFSPLFECVGIYRDGFETGDTTAWSNTVP